MNAPTRWGHAHDTDPIQPAPPPTGPTRFWPHGLAFAAVPLLLSIVAGQLTFRLNPHTADDIGLTAVPMAAWIFITVWTVIYPSMGIAAWLVWRERATGADASVPLVILAVGFMQTQTFWLADSLRAIAVVDATGVLLALATWWVFTRHHRTAAHWLLPWVAWMPITLTAKLAALGGVLST